MTSDRKKFVWAAVCIVLAAFLISRFCFRVTLIKGESMSPALAGPRLGLLSLMDRDFRRGDIVEFRCSGLRTVLIKRIAALPGDSVFIDKKGHLLVNGRPSEIYPPMVKFAQAGLASKELRLLEDQFFLIGDNVNKSRDSRFPEVGAVSRKDIIGKLIL